MSKLSISPELVGSFLGFSFIIAIFGVLFKVLAWIAGVSLGWGAAFVVAFLLAWLLTYHANVRKSRAKFEVALAKRYGR